MTLCARAQSAGRNRERKRVLILGGGFGGLAAAMEFDPARFEVSLIDRQRHFEFLPTSMSCSRE